MLNNIDIQCLMTTVITNICTYFLNVEEETSEVMKQAA